MASNDGYVTDPNVTQQRIEVKEEIENTYSSTEVCFSAGTNTNDLDEFVKTLSYDEIVSSIEIVKQLQQALIGTDQSEIEEQCAGNYTDIKQEKESESVSDNHPEECMKNEAFLLQGISGPFKSENENALEERAKENSDQTSNNLVLSIDSDLLGSLPSDTESSADISLFNYKAVDSTGHLKQEYLERKRDIVPFLVYTNNNQAFDGATLSPSKRIIFNNTEINEGINRQNSLVTASSPSRGDDNIIKARCNEVKSSGRFFTKVETNCQEALLDGGLEAELSGSKGEYNFLSKSYEYPQEKQRVKIKSRIKRKTENSFSDLEDLRKPFQCELCEYKCTARNNLRLHMKTHTGDKPFECELCGYKCTRSGYLKIHMRTHTGDKPFQCDLCSYKCTQRGNLKIHMSTHIGDKPSECELCGYKCTRGGLLKLHMRTHTANKPFQCEICGYECLQRGTLKRHMRTHTGDKPFQCDLCAYKCSERGNLKTHMRIHTGDKPFACDLCAYKCTHSGHLRRHMRIHTEEKPFQCKLCAYKCIQNGLLKSHMITHTGDKPFGCDLCAYKCVQRGNLKIHMRMHTGDKPFECDLCGYKFTHSGHLKRHKRTHTGEKTFQSKLFA